MVIFSRKTPWLLGKPTILGNNHFWRNHNFLSACICGCVFIFDFSRRICRRIDSLISNEGPKRRQRRFLAQRETQQPLTLEMWSGAAAQKATLPLLFSEWCFFVLFLACFLLLVVLCCAARRWRRPRKQRDQQPEWMMRHLRRPGIEMSKKELNLLVEHQRQELEKLRKAACNLIWRIRCSLDCSQQQRGGCLVWLS